MSVTKIGDCAYIYGIDGQGITGISIESRREETEPEFEATATDDEGNVAAVVRGGDKITYTIGGYVSGDLDLNAFGCKINIDGHECHIEKWSINRSNNDFAKCELTAVKYPAAQVCC